MQPHKVNSQFSSLHALKLNSRNSPENVNSKNQQQIVNWILIAIVSQ